MIQCATLSRRANMAGATAAWRSRLQPAPGGRSGRRKRLAEKDRE